MWAEKTRNLTLRAMRHLVTKRNVENLASVIISASPQSAWRTRTMVQQIAVGGLTAEELSLLGAIVPRTPSPFRVISVTRLLGWKGLGLAMRAFAQFKSQFPNSEYWIIGDGPEKRYLQHLASTLGISDSVRLLGKLPRQSVLLMFQQVDVLLHASIHEQFGFVILEAMAAGKPAICLDVGGPSLILNSSVGCTVRANSMEEGVEAVTRALTSLACDPGRLREMGASARKYVQGAWDWSVVGERISSVLAAAVDHHVGHSTDLH